MIVDQALSDRLYADALSASLRAPDSFYAASATGSWKDIESYVRARAANHRINLSSNRAVAERAIDDARTKWRGVASGDGPVRYVSLLANAARKLLQADGREMILRVDRGEPGREILRWRYVSLALPPGILIAAATDSGFAAPNAVRILNASMSPDCPVAQNHLHHAAMTSFEDLWVSLRMRALTQIGDFTRGLQELRAFCPGLHPGVCIAGRPRIEKPPDTKARLDRAKHMAEWADLIRQAYISSRVIDQHSWHSVPLATCHDPICKTGRMTLRAFLAGHTTPYRAGGTAYPWPNELFTMGRRYRQAHAPAVLLHSPQFRTDLVQQLAMEERNFLVQTFAYLARTTDAECELLFLQYLRVKTAVFGLLVHPPGEHGLENFLDHFTQIKVYAPESDFLRPPKPDEPGLDVRATEYRVAPDSWLTILRRDDHIEEGLSEEEVRSEEAWLIHFKRKEAGKKLPLFIDEVRSMESDATKIAGAIDQKPTRLRTLRGIDICGVEGWQPLWVCAQSLLRLRDRSRLTTGRRPGLRLEPLRLTIHCGEDVRWLTSGVRSVAEPFHWNLMERGDRIGHCLAITLDPKKWFFRRKGEVFRVKAFDRLLDLAFLAEYTKRRSAVQERWLRREIKSVVNLLRLEPDHSSEVALVETAKAVWKSLGGRLTRRLMETPEWQGDSGRPHERWIHSYLWKRTTQSLAKTEIQMTVGEDGSGSRVGNDGNEMNLLLQARKKLIRDVALWQVCIESNPSSNLVVGSLDSMLSQDFLQRRPTIKAGFGDETLTWTISTDDPITFSTTLADEYAYAWAGMVLRKENPYDPSYARALLDEAAETSMRMRFTIPRETPGFTTIEERKDRNRARRD